MPVSEAQKRATAAYEKKNYDKILVRFPKGVKGRIELQSESVNAYIIQAVIERLEADEDDFLQEEPDTNKEQTEPIKATKTNQFAEPEKMAELQRLLDAKKAEEQERERKKRNPEPEEPEKPDAYTDEDGNPIEDPRQYLIDMARQKKRRDRERLEQIHGKEYASKLHGKTEETSHTEAETAQISHTKEERKEIHTEPTKGGNKANKEPIDIYTLQAELDAKREEERRREAEKEAEKERKKQRQSDELVEKIQQMRQEQQERKEQEIEEDREKFPKFDGEKLKATLLSDKEFREDCANPKYKDEFIKDCGKYNYAMMQKCLQEIEKDEKERVRQESIQRAKMDY